MLGLAIGILVFLGLMLIILRTGQFGTREWHQRPARTLHERPVGSSGRPRGDPVGAGVQRHPRPERRPLARLNRVVDSATSGLTSPATIARADLKLKPGEFMATGPAWSSPCHFSS